MRTLWVFCAVAVVFTLHCLTVPWQRQRPLATGEAAQVDSGDRERVRPLWDDEDARTLDEQGVQAGAVCDPANNYRAVRAIENYYELTGYYSATVTLVSGGSHDDCEIAFEIDEGPQGMLAGIYFTGNQSFPSKVLRPCLDTRIRSLPENLPWPFWSVRRFTWNSDSDENAFSVLIRNTSRGTGKPCVADERDIGRWTDQYSTSGSPDIPPAI